MRFRFVHAADLHLDTPFEGLARSSGDVAEVLRDASLAAWDALVALAIDREAAFLLLAGDVYDGAERGVRAQLRVLRGLERLAEHGISVFIVHGNHDPADEGWSAIRQWPEGVTVFGSDAVESATVTRGGRVLARVHGRSYARREVRDNLSLDYRRSGVADGALEIGLLHCNVGGASDHADYSPCSVDDLCTSGLDYWALGHVHRRAVLREGEPWIVYPGNLQGRSPKPSERGAKGAFLVEVELGTRTASVRDAEFVPLDRVRFVALEVDVGDCADLADLERTLEERVRSLREEHAGRGLVLRLQLVGRGPCAADLRRAGAQAQLLDALRDAWQNAAPFVWWESVRSSVRAALDREALARGGDFRAELLALSDALATDSERLADFAAGQLDGVPSRAARDAGDLSDPAALLVALREAEALVLDMLEPEDSA